MKKPNAILIAIAMLALLPLAGCKDPYGACAKAGADIANAITQGMNTVDQAQQTGLISAAEEKNVVGYLEYANKADETFLACVAASHKNTAAGAFTACVQTFQTTLNSPAELELIHVVNPQAQATVTGITTTIAGALTALVSGLNGA
jgi:hypothetical protein